MNDQLGQSTPLDATTGDLLDDVLSAMDVLVAHQRISAGTPEERFLLGGAIERITADLTTLVDTMRTASETVPGLLARLELLRAELKKSNSAARAYQFAASHYGAET